VDSKKFRSIANAAERERLEFSAALQMQRSVITYVLVEKNDFLFRHQSRKMIFSEIDFGLGHITCRVDTLRKGGFEEVPQHFKCSGA